MISEKYRNDLKTTFRQGISATFIDLFYKVLIILTGIIVAWAFGPKGKGDFALLANHINISTSISLLGINFSHVYLIGKRKYSLSAIIGNVLFFSLIGLFLSLIVIYISLKFLSKNTEYYVGYFVVVFFGTILNMAFLHINSILLGLEKIISLKLITLTSPLALIFSFLIFGGRTENTGLYIALIILISYLAGFIANAVYMVVKGLLVKPSHFGDREIVKDSLSYGIRNWAGNVLYALTTRLDFFIIAYFASSVQVGYYSVSASFAELLVFLPTSFSSIMLPKFARLDESDAVNTAAIIIRHVFTLSIPLAVLFIIFGKQFIVLLYSDKFISAYTPFLILILGTLFISILGIMFNFFAGIGKPELPSLLLFINLIVIIILDLVLIPRYSIIGAAFASTISRILLISVTIVLFVKKSNISISRLFIMNREDFTRLYNVTVNWLGRKG